jgi:hypothetical protein
VTEVDLAGGLDAGQDFGLEALLELAKRMGIQSGNRACAHGGRSP